MESRQRVRHSHLQYGTYVKFRYKQNMQLIKTRRNTSKKQDML